MLGRPTDLVLSSLLTGLGIAAGGVACFWFGWWHSDWRWLAWSTQAIAPTIKPMTALLFIPLGLGLSTVAATRNRQVQLLAGVCVLVPTFAAWTTLERGYGLNQMLVPWWAVHMDLAPSPPTLMVFTLLGLSLCDIRCRAHHLLAVLALALAAVIPLAVMTAGVIAYLSHATLDSAGMALPTATLFFAAILGFIRVARHG